MCYTEIKERKTDWCFLRTQRVKRSLMSHGGDMKHVRKFFDTPPLRNKIYGLFPWWVCLWLTGKWQWKRSCDLKGEVWKGDEAPFFSLEPSLLQFCLLDGCPAVRLPSIGGPIQATSEHQTGEQRHCQKMWTLVEPSQLKLQQLWNPDKPFPQCPLQMPTQNL